MSLKRKAALTFSGVAFLILLICIASLLQGRATPNQDASRSVQNTNQSPGTNEIIWAGLAGNPPRFIDAGDEKGLGYVEVQSKLIRKALVQAGFVLRNEYFSSARIAHEFSRRSPICFYPTEWGDPKAVFATPPDRIYSIPLDFKGEEILSIVIRKEDEDKFKKFSDAKGVLKIEDLLNDTSQKTLLPKTEGLGPEFKKVYRTNPDGSTEITTPYKRHISTRVIRDNHQLIQMLNGGRFDYLLDSFIIQDDYRSIKTGKTPFVSLPYQIKSIKSVTDPQIKFVSVTCGVHDTAIRAMPVINSIIQTIRGPEWSYRSLQLQEQFDGGTGGTETSTLAFRSASEIAQGKADNWYSEQMKYFPTLKKFSLPPNPIQAQEGPGPSKQNSELSWWLLFPSPEAAWLLPKTDAIYLATTPSPSFLTNKGFGPALAHEQIRAWSPKQIDLLKKAVEGTVHPIKGNFETLLQEVLRVKHLRSFSLLARPLPQEQLTKISPILTSGSLTGLELVSAHSNGLRIIFPLIPTSLERINFWGSNLKEVQLGNLIRKLPGLREVNLSATLLEGEEFEEALSSLSSQVQILKAGYQARSWTEARAKKFGAQVLPKLEVLDLAGNDLDDRHCDLFQAIPPTLQELRLNGNHLTSNCLQRLFSNSMPKLQTLELGLARFSTKKGSVFRFPPSVKKLDLSNCLDDRAVSNLILPPKIKSLALANSFFGMQSFAKFAQHLDPEMDLLDLTDTNWGANINFTLFKELEKGGVVSIRDLRLSNVNFSPFDLPPETVQEITRHSIKSLKVQEANLRNTRLSNALLAEISSHWGPYLKAIDLSQNLISSQNIVNLIRSSPNLKSLNLSDLPDLDVQEIANTIPPAIRTLQLASSGITDSDLQALIPKLPKTLTSLDLSRGLFGSTPKTVPLLSEYLCQKAQDLAALSLKTPLPEKDWNLLLSRLPPSLKSLAFGPATLDAQTTSEFLTHLPKGLDRLDLESVHLRVSQASELINQLPRGLSGLAFLTSSSLVETDAGGRNDLEAHWPDPLRILRLTPNLSAATLASLLNFLPSSVNQVFVKNPKISAPLFDRLLNRKFNPLALDLSGATFDPEMIQSLNRTQTRHLQLINSSFPGGGLSKVDARALSRLKKFSLVGNSIPGKDILLLLKKLPPNMQVLDLASTQIKYSEVDTLIKTIPAGLDTIYLRGAEIGPKGYEKLQKYSQQLEEESGMKLWVVY